MRRNAVHGKCDERSMRSPMEVRGKGVRGSAALRALTVLGTRGVAAGPVAVAGALFLVIVVAGAAISLARENAVEEQAAHTEEAAPLPVETLRSVSSEKDESVADTMLGHSEGESNRAMLTEGQQDLLTAHGWSDRVGARRAVWVSVREQVLRIIDGGAIVLETACSTARNGVGSQINSGKTPLGWHSVAEKIGEGAAWGQVFRDRKPTRERWQPGDKVSEDLVLTRVLTLAGEEPGKNKGGDVDSLARYIYIHGTNDEEHIGKPESHGCVRLKNDDVVRVFDLLAVGTPVLITE